MAMRSIISICIVSLLCATFSMAQTAPSKSVRSTAVPSATPRNTTTAPKSTATQRSGSTGAAAERSSNNSGQKTGLRPSETSLRNARGSYNDNQQTARGVSSPNRRVPAIQLIDKVKVNWISLEEALERSKTEKRKIFVDVYTDWCGWCKHMDSTTFVNPKVANYLNEHYYAVKLDAEQQQDIIFKDKTYHFKKTGSRGYHELAALWLNNRLSYPTVVFLDEYQNLIQPVPGYQDATKMEAIINYFGSDSHRKTPWETYEKNFTAEH
jgi:thioredoxin-related protein